MSKEIEKWITVNGKHIPIYKQTSYELTTKEEVDDILMDMNDEDFKKQMKIKGHRYFAQDFGRDLNSYLYANSDMDLEDMRPDYQGAVRDLDNAMVGLPRAVVSERYVDEHSLPDMDTKHPEKMVGKTIHTEGYLSTTINAEGSDFEFSNYPARVIIQAPKGTPAVLGANYKEAEILFHRNSDYEITSYEIGKNHYGRKQIVYYAVMKK